MERTGISNLESLLKFPNGSYGNEPVYDASVLTCGCLVSELYFQSLTSAIPHPKSICPNCKKDAELLAGIEPLRELYSIIKSLSFQETKKNRRRSSSKKSQKPFLSNLNETSKSLTSLDLMGLLFSIAKDESHQSSSLEMKSPVTNEEKIESSSAPPTKVQDILSNIIPSSLFDRLEKHTISKFSEEKEYNFSKCFPFYRKISTYHTQQIKFSFPSITNNPFKHTSVIKKNWIYSGSDIHTHIDMHMNKEVTRFALITKKKWEVYEYIEDFNNNNSGQRPYLLCCGRLSGEFGEDFSNLSSGKSDQILIKNDFSAGQSDGCSTVKDDDIKKRLNNWELVSCKISKNYLIISGTKCIMRVFNLSHKSSKRMGEPIYTYVTNFPLRCFSISPNECLIATGISAKERLSGKEQPFIVLHKLIKSSNHDLSSVMTTTVAIPRRDPIKFMNFSPSSTHLICCTVWESRCLIIRLFNEHLEYLKKPRLIWSESPIQQTQKGPNVDDYDSERDVSEYSDQNMDEGITDIEFGRLFSNTLVISASSWKEKNSMVLRLDGASFDSTTTLRSFGPIAIDDTVSLRNTLQGTNFDDYDNSANTVTSMEVIMRIPEIGTGIKRVSILPRGDGMAFLDREGRIFLVSTPNFLLYRRAPQKKIVVLLGEVAGSENATESATIKFSADGGKLFAVDRKGMFLVFDFTKGTPGTNSDVVKCKIINA